MPTPHQSVFYRPDALPVAQPTVSKHWKQNTAEIKTQCACASVLFAVISKIAWCDCDGENALNEGWCTVLPAFLEDQPVLAGLPTSTLAPFQRVLQAAAHIVLDLKLYDRVTPALLGDLVVQWTCRRIGDRAFSVTAPRACNRLPRELKLLQ